MHRDLASNDRLRFHWDVAFLHLEITRSDYQDILDDIVSKYSEPHREYHNATHIAKMIHCLSYLDYFFPKMNIEDMYQLIMATIFHDVIYDPSAKDNEEQSADYAKRTLEFLGINESFISNVVAYILCTKTHEIDPSLPYSAAMIDADLAVLSAEPVEYYAYAQAIRAEYDFVSDEDYRVGRTMVLESFLMRDSIYQVSEYRDEFEAIVRQNLAQEIASLNS
jgi:predicted metal-dependent HD superfamily phosphohydrolase